MQEEMDKSILQMNNLMCNMTKKEDRNKVRQRVRHKSSGQITMDSLNIILKTVRET